MKVKFNDVICMGNKTYVAGDVAEFTDVTAQQLIDKKYAELAVESDASDDESEAKVKTAKKTTTKAE